MKRLREWIKQQQTISPEFWKKETARKNGSLYAGSKSHGRLQEFPFARAFELSGAVRLYLRNRRDIIISIAVNRKASVIRINLLPGKYKEKPLAQRHIHIGKGRC